MDDSYTTPEDTALHIAAIGILANDADADGDSLTAALVSGPAHGTLTLDANGGFDYTPALDYNGPDSFTYRANDGQEDSIIATVRISVSPVEVTRTVEGGNGPDTFTDAAGFATTYFAGNGNDVVSGLDRADVLHGGKGNDFLLGGSGNDFLYGENGDDRLDGGSGNDLLVGGPGKDWLTGGSGSDTFAFGKSNDADMVADFEVGIDHIQFNDGATVKSVINTDVDHTGSTDVVLQLDTGFVTLLGVGLLSDWHALI